MTKKKTAKKSARKVARKVPILVEPNPVETEIKLVPVKVEDEIASPVVAPKPKAVSAPVASKAKAEPKSSRGSWPGKEKGYPDPFHVSSEGKTATDRIFVLKKDQYIWDIYGTRKIIIPLG